MQPAFAASSGNCWPNSQPTQLHRLARRRTQVPAQPCARRSAPRASGSPSAGMPLQFMGVHFGVQQWRRGCWWLAILAAVCRHRRHRRRRCVPSQIQEMQCCVLTVIHPQPCSLIPQHSRHYYLFSFFLLLHFSLTVSASTLTSPRSSAWVASG